MSESSTPLVSELMASGLHILSEYRWRVQADNYNEMGTSALRHVDSRGITWQCHIPRTGARRREGSENTLETCKLTVFYPVTTILTLSTVLLYLQTEDGCLHTVRTQVLF